MKLTFTMSGARPRRKRYHATASQQREDEWSSSHRRPNPCKLFVTNISFKISSNELKDFFVEFGCVKRCHVVTDGRTRRSRGFGFIVFESVDAVEKVLSATEDQLILDGRTMRVDRSNSTKRLLARESGDGHAMGEGGDGHAMGEDGDDGEGGGGGDGEEGDLSNMQLTECSVPELNDDVLILVFRRLDLKDRVRVERVSRRWYHIAQASWQNVHHISFHNCFHSFRGKYGGLSDGILQSVLRRCGKHLASLDLSATPKLLTDFGIDLIGMYCTLLERLDLSGVSVTQRSFRQMSEKCANLKWLRFDGCHTVGEKCVWWALHNLKQLQYIDISNNRRIKGQCFFMSGSTLCHVYLQSCEKLIDSSMELLAARCPQLRSLDISHCCRLTGNTIQSITKYCRELTILQFNGPNPDVTISDMMTIGRLHSLEVLKVDQQAVFGDEALKMLGRECLNLRVLSCAACYAVTDSGISCLSTCRRLSDITISYCHLVTDQGLVQLLHESVRRICARACHGVTDYGVDQIARVCHQLEELDVSGCLGVSNTSLLSLQTLLLHNHSAPHHTFTLLAGGSCLDDAAVLQFATATGATVNLRDLSLPSLLANYDPLLFIAPLESQEEEEEEVRELADVPSLPSNTHALPEPREDPLDYLEDDPHSGDYLLERAEEFLVADDPALYSDEFSEPEEWGFG